MKIDPSPKKMLLRDWMTATTQVLKSKDSRLTSIEIANLWGESFPGLKMNERWVDKALYGVQKIIKKGG